MHRPHSNCCVSTYLSQPVEILADLPSCRHNRLPCWHPALIRGCTRTWLSQSGWHLEILWNFHALESHGVSLVCIFFSKDSSWKTYHPNSFRSNYTTHTTWHRGPAPGGAAADPEAGLGCCEGGVRPRAIDMWSDLYKHIIYVNKCKVRIDHIQMQGNTCQWSFAPYDYVLKWWSCSHSLR